MKQYSFDVHMHTHYSYDCLVTPKSLVKNSIDAGLSTIIVTDHNTITGALKTREIGIERGLSVFIGSEVKTEFGDVIGFFLKEKIRTRRFSKVINEIKGQGGIVYLPHPYIRSTNLSKMDLSVFDVIEEYNGRCSREENSRSKNLGESLKVPTLGGSDSHTVPELGTVQNSTESSIQTEEELRKVILNSQSIIEVSRPQPSLLPRRKMTQFVSWLRVGDYGRFVYRTLLYPFRKAAQVLS
jgi:predicted metal-dependent phosphoesterase TrpH